jgi:hypothetical protein
MDSNFEIGKAVSETRKVAVAQEGNRYTDRMEVCFLLRNFAAPLALYFFLTYDTSLLLFNSKYYLVVLFLFPFGGAHYQLWA